MENIRIALLQLLPGTDAAESLTKGIEACRRAKELGADIALFPEMWSSGYVIPEDTGELEALAVPADGSFVEAYRDLARELGIAIGITLLEAHEGGPRNTMILFDMTGREVFRYAKVHTCDFGDECRLSQGEEFFAEDLETEKGWIRVGSMICYDREFPESARILMLLGAELILVPNACPMEINRLSQLRGRAYENMVAIATCNYPAGQPDCNGHSTLFDGVAYLPELAGSRDMCVFEAPEEEGIYIAELDVMQLRSYRAAEVHGNAFRRPDKYGLLLNEEKEYPFLRSSGRKKPWKKEKKAAEEEA